MSLVTSYVNQQEVLYSSPEAIHGGDWTRSYKQQTVRKLELSHTSFRPVKELRSWSNA